MKKAIVSMAVVLGSCVTSPSYAHNTTPVSQPAHWSFGPEVASYSYRETNSENGEQLIRLTGPLYGLNVEYHHPLKNARFDFWNISGRFLWGTEDYQGFLINYSTWERTPYSVRAASQSELSEIRVNFGRHYNENTDLYAGLGIRGKADAPTSNNPYGYARKSSYVYIPFGLTAQYSHQGIQYKPFVEYDYLLLGTQTASLANQHLTFAQTAGYGVKFGISVSMKQWEIRPYVNYWSLPDSSRQTRINHDSSLVYFWEPQNETVEVGLKVHYRY